MAGKNVYTSEKAIPAWMKVKDTIWETSLQTKIILKAYRERKNRRDLLDFANSVVSLYDLIRDDYENDDKLTEKFPEVEKLKTHLIDVQVDSIHTPQWWLGRYNDLTTILWLLNITKITRENDEDDDFAGVPGFDGI